MKQFPFICAMIMCFALMAVPAFAQAPECIIGEVAGSPESDDGIVPVYTEQCTNPTCSDLGYPDEYKADPPNADDYSIGSDTISVTRDGDFFDWSSTFGIDAVIAKGGPHANIYQYNPADNGDSGLAAPADCGGQQCGLSHISFCYNDECACDDGNACTVDTCDQAGACVFTPKTCDDGNECTTDECIAGACISTQIPDCGVNVPEFPTLAVPAAMIIGLIGAVLFIQGTRK